MCLAIPAQVIKIFDDGRAIVQVGGVEKEVSLVLVEDVKVDDYVIIHVGFALSKLDEDEAKKTLGYFEAILEEN